MKAKTIPVAITEECAIYYRSSLTNAKKLSTVKVLSAYCNFLP